MEPDLHQREPRSSYFSSLDPGPRPCPDLWLDRDFHFGNRLLLHSQDGGPQFLLRSARMDRVGALDSRRTVALGGWCVPMAMAHSVADFGSPGTGCLHHLLFGGPPASAGRSKIEKQRVAGLDSLCADWNHGVRPWIVDESRWVNLRQYPGALARVPSRVRRPFSCATGVWIYRPNRLGFQRAMAAGFPWPQAPG